MIISLMTFVAALWVTCIYYRKRQKIHLFLAFMLYVEILARWPLYWNQLIPLGLISVLVAGLLFYEAHLKKEKVFMVYGLVALGVGCVLFIQVIPTNHVVLKNLAQLCH